MSNRFIHEQLPISADMPIIARHYDYDMFTYNWHLHNEFEIIHVKESVGDMFVADSMGPFGPGDVIVVGHGVPHYLRSADDYRNGVAKGRVKGTIIQFEENFMAHAIDNYADLSHVKVLLEESARGIYFPPAVNREVVKLIEKMPGYSGKMRIIGLLQLLDVMAEIEDRKLLGTQLFHKSSSTAMNQRMEKILTYATAHFRENIDLTTMASLVAMNTSSFSRYFKMSFGKTFQEYIMNLRIGHACKLLVESTMDVVQVCLESGFNSTAHFNRIFKRYTGLTPTVYRKQFTR